MFLKLDRLRRELRVQQVQFPDFRDEETGIERCQGTLLKATPVGTG
jgi:hypothetical protein